MADEVSHFGQNGKHPARSNAAAGRNFGDGIGVASAEKQAQDFGTQEPGGCRAALADELQNATHGLTAFAGGRLGFVAVGLGARFHKLHPQLPRIHPPPRKTVGGLCAPPSAFAGAGWVFS